MSELISPEFPFEPHYVDVLESRMHYVDEGDANSETTFLLLHGNPTSSYLWRNIIPLLTPHGRVIAPDLIGMGQSGKPDIDYRFVEHVAYLDAFIDKLELHNVILVIHDWGSALGFHYAHRNPNNVRGIAFMEAVLDVASWSDFPGAYKMAFKLFRNRVMGPLLIQRLNFFVNNVLPESVLRKLSDDEMSHYRAPYPDAASRKPLYRWPNEIPIDGTPADTHAAIAGYREWLKTTDALPKLLLWFKPGAIVRKHAVAQVEKLWPNLESTFIGPGLHFVQEDHPLAIGKAIADWYQRKVA